jgi:hypothetical protein
VAEGTSLLRMHMAYTRIVGSNPTVSAKFQRKKRPQGRFFLFRNSAGRQGEGSLCVRDSKPRARERAGGLQDAGESHRRRQIEKKPSKDGFFRLSHGGKCQERSQVRSIGNRLNPDQGRGKNVGRLRVAQSGSRSWIFRFSISGKGAGWAWAACVRWPSPTDRRTPQVLQRVAYSRL